MIRRIIEEWIEKLLFKKSILFSNIYIFLNLSSIDKILEQKPKIIIELCIYFLNFSSNSYFDVLFKNPVYYNIMIIIALSELCNK